MKRNRAARWALGLAFALPLSVVAAFFGYLAYQSWAALETLSVNTFGNGEVLEVTQIASGPIGSGHAYELGYRANAGAKLQLLDVWEYPSGEHQVQIYELGDLAVVLTPARDVLHVRAQAGSWRHWRVHDFLAFPALSADLLQVTGHEPRMLVERIDPLRQKIDIRIEYASQIAQNITLKPSEAGVGLDVVAVALPASPLADYAMRLQLEAQDKLLFIEWDLNGDGVREVLVSNEAARNGRAGHIWSVYVAQAEGFTLFDDTLSMRADALSTWLPKDESAVAYGITTYHPGSSRRGVLVTYSLEEDRLTSINTSVTPTDSSENAYLTAMAQENLVSISETNVADALFKLQQQ